MADLRISELPPLAEGDVAATDVLPISDLSASTTKKLTAKDLVQRGVVLIDDGVIDGGKLANDSVGVDQIEPNSITASELADEAVDTASIQDGAVTNDKIANGIDGAKLTNDTVTAAKIPAASLNRGIDKTGGAIGHTNSVVAGTHSGIQFDAQGHVTGTSAITAAELPIATDTQVGGVSVPAVSGLSVSGVGALSHTDTITAGSRSGITFNGTGHITATRALQGADLPSATSTTQGAVSVPGPALGVAADGTLTHSDSGVAAGTHQSVTVDARGHVTNGGPLTAAMVPNLDASKITTGTIPTARIADGAITMPKLANLAISFIQEGNPGNAGHPTGVMWLQESTGQLRMWNGNSWFSVGFGRLQAENLRFCGTFDATTDIVTGTTTFGANAGMTIGGAIPVAADDLTGVYLVCDVAGSTPGGVMPGQVFDAGDWILCLGATEGWTRIDTLNSGGGGGAQRLDDLLDVTITNVAEDEFLRFSAAGQWENVNVISGGTF